MPAWPDGANDVKFQLDANLPADLAIPLRQRLRSSAAVAIEGLAGGDPPVLQGRGTGLGDL